MGLPKATTAEPGLEEKLFTDVMLRLRVYICICLGREVSLLKGKCVPGYANAIGNSGDKTWMGKASKSL